ncbi:MAG: ThuA domain-containing protein [Verrucomicrobiales bacterium]|nr:ThuA domain-containing protein [Verrucomicrobiales bacterium]
MTRFFFVAFLSLMTAAASPAANIVIMTVEDSNNYDAVNSMRDFAEKELRPLGHQVTLVEGDQPKPNHFGGLVEALKKADLLVVFVRRRFPAKEEMAAIRAHLNAGKPLLGIRTANHAFIPKPNETVDVSELATWPEFTHEVLGGENTGYETKGMPYSVTVAEGAAGSPLLEGVNAANIRGHQSLYKVLPLADDAVPLLVGEAQVDATPPQPIAWTRNYGANHARIFYTSLGAPDDMKIADVRRLLVNGVTWTVAE